MPELTIDAERVGDDVCILRLAGFLDAHTFEQLDEVVGELFDEDVYKIVADLEGVEYISSAGAGVFIGSLTTAQENGGNIVLLRPNPNVREVFELLGLLAIFTLVEDPDEAMKVAKEGSA